MVQRNCQWRTNIKMDKRENKRPVVLQDIARETGYSVNTVSRALRNKKDISPATCERIQRTAREMGYMVNQLASSLRSGRTKLITVIAGSMSNPFYGIMTDLLQSAAAARGYSLLVMCSRERPDLELQMAETAASRRSDGILLFPTNASIRTVERLRELKVPVVLMARTLGEDVADNVISDETRGVYLAVRHLIEHGRRNLAFLSRQHIVFSYEKRLRGFLSACDEMGIPESGRRTFVCVPSATEDPLSCDWQTPTRERLIQWRREGVDGIFVFCDAEAWHVQSVIQQTPELMGWDVGIVGFDNIQGAQQYPAGLCSVDCAFDEMAARGIDLLRERIHGSTQPPQTIVCPVRMVCRGSCGGRES